jgi:hypothetical protein
MKAAIHTEILGDTIKSELELVAALGQALARIHRREILV